MDALLAFVVNLSTTNSSFVPECLDMVVQNFLPPSCGLPTFLDSCSRNEFVIGSLTVEKLRMRSAQHLANKDTVSL
jgi:RNA polymerase I-specific transcription initiation factor RRN3